MKCFKVCVVPVTVGINQSDTLLFNHTVRCRNSMLVKSLTPSQDCLTRTLYERCVNCQMLKWIPSWRQNSSHINVHAGCCLFDGGKQSREDYDGLVFWELILIAKQWNCVEKFVYAEYYYYYSALQCPALKVWQYTQLQCISCRQ